MSSAGFSFAYGTSLIFAVLLSIFSILLGPAALVSFSKPCCVFACLLWATYE